MTPEKIDILITKILLNEASEEEILIFHQWMKDSANKTYFEQVKLLWVSSTQKLAKDMPCNLKSKNQFLSFIQKQQRRRKLILYSSISAVAAVLTLSFVVWVDNKVHNGDGENLISNIVSDDSSLLVDKYIRRIEQQEVVLITCDGTEHILNNNLDPQERMKLGMTSNQLITQSAQQLTNENNTIQYNTLIVPCGKRFSVKLSDGTVMWVNSDTKVKYPVSFPKERREVWVEGNAYFEVAKDNNRPFSVKTGVITTIALGTIFEVENYDNFKCKITLLEGSVKVDNTQEEMRLKPSQQAVIEVGAETMTCNSVDAERYGRWKDNLLVFDDESLPVILAKLSRWHNVDIANNAHELDDVRFSGRLSDASLNEHLKLIASNIKIKYIIKDRNVYIGV